jgi:PilZ domain
MDERRSASRQRAFLQGRILFNNRRSSIDCVIRDLSETGARLRFSGAVATPEVVELYIPNKDESLRARVQWRAGNEMGIAFDVPESPPPLAPGAAPVDWAARIQKLEHDVVSLQRKVIELQAMQRKNQGIE